MSQDKENLGTWKKMYDKRVYNSVYRKDPTAWRVFDCLIALSDLRQGRIHTSERSIAKMLEIAKSTVHDAIERLTDYGMVKIIVTDQEPNLTTDQAADQSTDQSTDHLTDRGKFYYQLVNFNKYRADYRPLDRPPRRPLHRPKHADQEALENELQEPTNRTPKNSKNYLTGNSLLRRAAHSRAASSNSARSALKKKDTERPVTMERIRKFELDRWGNENPVTVIDPAGHEHSIPSKIAEAKDFEWQSALGSGLYTFAGTPTGGGK